jgi:hypothetical protein
MREPNDKAAMPPLPLSIKPLPNQMALDFDLDEARRQAALFDRGDDLPGADERSQQIFWDLPANS